MTACKNSSPAEKSTHFAFHVLQAPLPATFYVLEFSGSMKFKVFLAAKLPV